MPMMASTSHLLIKSFLFSIFSLKGKGNRLLPSIEQLHPKKPHYPFCSRMSYRSFRAVHNVPIRLPMLNFKSSSSRCFFSSGKRDGHGVNMELDFGPESMVRPQHILDPAMPNDIPAARLSTSSGTASLENIKRVHYGVTGMTKACIGSHVRSERRAKQLQLTVAVDIDEVLGSFLTALNTFVAEQYYLEHNVSEYHVYNFTEVWRCSRTEADQRVHAFFKSEHFNRGIHPIPGAYQSLLQIASYSQLFVVTSRQNIIKAATIAWIERHYSGIFKEVHFGNHFALEGEARSKSEICRSVGAHVLIDDNPVYAMDCAENGIEVLLFDYNNSYPWSKTPEGPVHPLITRVHNWEEVECALQARSNIACW